jgi:hypothetical protein
MGYRKINNGAPSHRENKKKVVHMNKYFVSLIILVMVFVGSCIFSYNNDYEKTISGNGGNTGTGEYTVSGVLIDKLSKPVSGITVNLVGDTTLNSVTNSKGEYLFENVPNGSYIVSTESGGYTPMPITVSGGDKFVGTVKNGGHGGNKNQDYSCSQCH